MSTIITPTNQQRINDPYQQRLFDFNTTDSKLYLSRASNQLLKFLGNNIVLNGFTYSNLLNTTNTISLDVAPGLAIIDQTLIEVSDTVSLDIDATPYDSSGHLVLYLSYQWLQTVTENPLRIKLAFVSSDGSSVLPDGWTPSRDNIIIGIFEFTKDASNNITSISEISTSPKQLLINGQTYSNFGYDGTASALDTFLSNSGGAGIFSGTTSPSNLNALWLDTSSNPAILKYYDGAAWVAIGSSNESSSGNSIINLMMMGF